MLTKILFRIKKLIQYVTIFMIAFMTAIITYQVISRFAFSYTPSWIQPLSLLLMVWIGFIGVAIGIQENSHIKINLFVSKFPKTIQTILIKFQRILAILFGVFMLVEGGKFAYSMRGSFISGLGIPSAVLYVSVPIAGVLVVFFLFFELIGKQELEEDQ